MPSDPKDVKGLIKTAVADPNPVIFIEHKFLYPVKGHVPEENYSIPFGKAEVKRKGTDVTIIATSLMVQKSLRVAEELSKEEGIEVEVVDPRTLLPLDKQTIIESVKKTGRAIVIDEGYTTCGVGAELSAVIMEEAFDYLDAPVKRLCAPDVPIPFTPVLEKYITPSEEQIAKEIKEII
jgi:pyruvate/2-oxoglutarate/acetoin dehydrogenase E1 component